ncbi:ribokinase [Rhizobiales bacterium GAS191]|jgi:ribokinase|nr:ribokinase [Rhizobiales bacterium GAS113]SEE50862.1 ribokinase [Rhizobiales bacterium GAS191]
MAIIVLGSINTDITAYGRVLPRVGETVLGSSYEMDLGGKGANQAAAAARLGAHAEFVGRVGVDAFGEAAMERLEAFGVSTRHSTRDPAQGTGIAIINVDAEGRNAITVISGANMHIDEAQLHGALPVLGSAKVLMLQLEIPLATCKAAALEAHRLGVAVVFDPAPAPAEGLPADLYGLIDVITPNETETEALLGYQPGTVEEAARAAHELVARGTRAAVVTLGARGAYVVGEGAEGFVAPFAVTPVSTVAAGDCFNAGLAVALSEGKTLMEAARFASACGALCTTKAGSAASAPTRQEVELLLARG